MSNSTQQRWHADIAQETVYDEDDVIVTYIIKTREDCCGIVADHNACLGIEDPETTVPELVAVLTKLLRWTGELKVDCDRAPGILEAQAVLAKTGKRDEPPDTDDRAECADRK